MFMNEIDMLKIINKNLSSAHLIGDDCAFLDDMDIFVTHDTLVENVHFSLYTISPYLLGRKSIAVNLSDLAAALCEPKYLTISLSMPSNVKGCFVDEFYKGVNDICNEYGVKVIGGDLTSSEKVVVSVCAIGKKTSLFLSSRKFAKKDNYIVVTGFHGSSSAAFFALSNFLYVEDSLINDHLNPVPALKESKILSNIIDSNIAVIDTSDGLIDALFKISSSSKHSIDIDINKVPVRQELLAFCKRNNLDYKKFVKWGGEDYQLVACVTEEVFKTLDKNLFTCIGKIMNKATEPCVFVKDFGNSEKITKDIFYSNMFNHFNN